MIVFQIIRKLLLSPFIVFIPMPDFQFDNKLFAIYSSQPLPLHLLSMQFSNL